MTPKELHALKAKCDKLMSDAFQEPPTPGEFEVMLGACNHLRSLIRLAEERQHTLAELRAFSTNFTGKLQRLTDDANSGAAAILIDNAECWRVADVAYLLGLVGRQHEALKMATTRLTRDADDCLVWPCCGEFVYDMQGEPIQHSAKDCALAAILAEVGDG